ncbi:hypothetical protein IC619_015335 [Hazenella sp. IB182353]|uniref:hypothetical protein n=1 Tax=Polycladospora coralii TaxID=2771432 RepID=UPI0017472F4E|nr:hypothetical protein [Polycladospora coralii]MBS7531845.1 hypothetical protein [Polycladospora coralii]
MNSHLQLVAQEEQQTSNYVPTLSMTSGEAKNLIQELDHLKQDALRKGIDYDKIPSTPKPTLLKPGAERLLQCFGFGHKVSEVRHIEDWEKGFFHYVYKVTIVKTYPTYELTVAECEGSCNSKESKYAYRWVKKWEVERMGLNINELQKKKDKYRINNDDIYSQVNTLQKMAIKRALVGATLQATGTSEFFTQDVEDMPQFQQQREQPTPQQQQQNFQSTLEDKLKRGRSAIAIEAETNKKLTKEERKAILKAEIHKDSLTDLDIHELKTIYEYFNKHTSEELKEIAKAHMAQPEPAPVIDADYTDVTEQKADSHAPITDAELEDIFAPSQGGEM